MRNRHKPKTLFTRTVYMVRQITKCDLIYRVAQLQWGQLTFLIVTFECIVKTGSYSQKNIIINSNANKYQQNHKQAILP